MQKVECLFKNPYEKVLLFKIGIWAISLSGAKRILYKKIGCLNIQLSQSGQSWQCRQTKGTMKFVSFTLCMYFSFISKTNFYWSDTGYRHLDFDSRHLLGFSRSVSIPYLVWISTCLLTYYSYFSSCRGVDCAKCKKAFQGIDCQMTKLCDTDPAARQFGSVRQKERTNCSY